MNEWHSRLEEADRKKHPKKHPYAAARNKKPSPGPGQYKYEDSTVYQGNKTFQKANHSAFGVDENKKIHAVDEVQIPQARNPGAGSYNLVDKPEKKAQRFTSNMMSQT